MPLPRVAASPGLRAATLAGVLLAASLALSACSHTRHVTHTPRTATEQLLVTESTERAVKALALPGVEGRRVAIDLVGVAPGAEFYDDLPYLEATLARRLRDDGAVVVGDPGEAERVLGVRVGALATTSTQSSFGLPEVPLVVGAVPALKIYRTFTQHGFTKLRVTQRDADGTRVAGEEVVMERTRFKVRKLFFLTFRSERDIYPKGLGPD